MSEVMGLFDDQDDAPRTVRRRRRWPWLVAVLVVLLLIVAAFFAGEWVARDLVTKAVKQQLVSRLDLAADQQIDVDIADPSLLLDLAVGEVGQVRISADDVTIGDFTGDVSVTLHDLGIRSPFTLGSGEATVAMNAEQLRPLLAEAAPVPVDGLTIAEPAVSASTQLSVFGVAIPVDIALTPSSADGQLVLTPASLTVAGAEVTADGVRAQFGSVVDPLLAGYRVCVAQYLPRGLTLSHVAVQGDRLVADFAIAGDLLTDAGAREKGSCA